MQTRVFDSACLVKRLPWVLALLGLAVSLWLVLRQGPDEILAVLSTAGWPLLWILPFHLLPLLLDVASWRVLLAPYDARRRAVLPYLLWVGFVREAVARLLPLASVGGELVGIRLLMLRGLGGAVATASVVVQVLLAMVNQYLFAILGVLLLLRRLILLGLLLSSPLALLAWLMFRHGRVFERMQSVLQRLIGDRLKSLPTLSGAEVDQALRDYYRQSLRLSIALLWEFAGLMAGAFEYWFALRLLGHAVSPAVALALEASTHALRHIFFMVPGALGVQEAGLLLFGSILGLPADVAITLSLIRRLREILLGMPALLSWQWLELRHLRRR